MSFSNIPPQDWAMPASPTDLARIEEAENRDRTMPTTDLSDGYAPEDLDWVAADCKRREKKELKAVLRSSQNTAAVEESRRSANDKAARDIRLALDISRVEAEQADILRATSQSQRDERARARAAQEKQEREQAILESKAAAERERQQKAEERARLLANYAVRGLTEEQQFQLGIQQSQNEEQAGQQPATQEMSGRPALGAISSYPPGSVTEQEQRSVVDGQEPIEDPNTLLRPVMSIAETPESRPASVRSAVGFQSSGPTTLLTTSTKVSAPVYPGAYPLSPSQASLATHSTVGRSTLDVSTPTLPGAYPQSYASSEVPRSSAGPLPRLPSWRNRVYRRHAGDSTSSERLPGAYPPSSQASNVLTRSGTVSSEGTFITAQEMQPHYLHKRPRSALSDLWHHESGAHREHEAQGSRPSTSLSFSPPSSEASSAVRPPSSYTSHGSIARKPVARSQPLPLATVESRAPATALDAATPTVVVPSHSQRAPIQYVFNGPVTVNNYNIPGEPSSSSTMFKSVINKGMGLAKGVKLIEQKSVAGFDLRAIGEATRSRCKSTAAFFREKSNRFEVSLPSRTARAPVSEAGEIDRVSVPEVQDDVGSIATLPQTQHLFVANPDLSRSDLNTPDDGRSLQEEFPMRQTVDVVTVRTPTLHQSVMPPPPPTMLQRRPFSPNLTTASMILDVNGDAVTPPSDRQSDWTGSLGDSSVLDGLSASGPIHNSIMPRPENIEKRPPPVPRKPLALASTSSTPPPPPPKKRNPVSRYLAQQDGGHAQWGVQQPVPFPIMYPTEGAGPNSPDSVTATAPTPGRVNEALNRRSQFAPIDPNLANVPPGERAIDQFNSRSMADLGRMAQVGDPACMEVMRDQYEQTYARAPHELQERQNSDARARAREKETQKFLRRQL